VSTSPPAERCPVADPVVLARRLRRALHRHPEVGHHEHRSAGYVERLLRRLGLRPWRPAPTSVAAVVGPAGRRPVQGFRADLDALPLTERTAASYASRVPGRMHACGHDGHTAALLLLAARLAAAPPTEPVLLVFQAAEEVHPSGAQQVLRGIPDELMPPEFYAAHLWPQLPAGVLGVRAGPLMASVAGITIVITGRPGLAHGTAAESGGADALAAGVQLYRALTDGGTGRVLDATRPAALYLGRLAGGEHPHRVPTRCELAGTMRALSAADEDALVADVRAAAGGVAARTDTRIEVHVESGIRPPVRNTAAAVDSVVAACEATGTPWRRYPPRPLGVSEDFGWYLSGRDGALVLLGCAARPDHPDLHTPTFDFDEAVLLAIVDVFDHLARARRPTG
jgi:amidohydrolase